MRRAFAAIIRSRVSWIHRNLVTRINQCEILDIVVQIARRLNLICLFSNNRIDPSQVLRDRRRGTIAFPFDISRAIRWSRAGITDGPDG